MQLLQQKNHNQKSLTNYKMIKLFLTLVICISFTVVFAQPGKTQSIDINSSYKPVLRNAVKINLSGSQLPTDTSLPRLSYKIPSQNLFYAYKPISLKPLALEEDTNLYLGNRNFVKAGFGNFTTPYLRAGVSIGDGKISLLNITADYISSKGTALKNQSYSNFNAKVAGSYFMPKNELYGSFDMGLRNYLLYGYDQNIFVKSKDTIKQSFQDVTLRAGFKNTHATETGINYNPNIELNLFTSKDKLNETNAIINLPFDKVINDNVSAKVELKADITNYTSKNLLPANVKFNNTIVQIIPTVNLYNDQFILHLSVIPAWNNKAYEVLPNITGEAKIKDKIFSVQAGWVGRFVKNNYRNLSTVNPYLSPLSSQINTTEKEIYGGIKASIAKHFNFSAKAGLVSYKNLPLFINDTTTLDGSSFKISNETSVQNFRIHGDLNYINQDKFSLTGSLTLNGYTLLKSNDRAWHTIPFELAGSLRWWALKTVLVKSDLRLFDGSYYLAKGNVAKPLSGGTDLSAGVEIKLTKNISVWADANNILNSKYERWHNYEVYGANFMGGILLHF
jgi:hypothetical protein